MHRMTKAIFLIVVTLCVSFAQPYAQAQSKADASTLNYRLAARELAKGVYVVEGDNADFSVANGCNIINTGFVVTGAGVVVINTGPSKTYGEQLRALIKQTTPQPIAQVIHLNLHPDYFLGNQAFADVPRYATDVTRAGMQREAKSYEDNLYRLCGDWMKGTEALLPDRSVAPGVLKIGGRELELLMFDGHTDSDLVVIDKSSGVMFAGGLVFTNRVPTTPHAMPARWMSNLKLLDARAGVCTWVPSHGPVRQDKQGLQDTLSYLQWLDAALSKAAASGMEMNEVLRLPVPAQHRQLAAFNTEFVRNITHLYPRYERQQLLR
jgi:quinoprotein relay system zinc metallohydrolase 1